MPKSRKKLGLLFWSVLPCLITLSFVVIYLVPNNVSGLGNFMPLLPMIPIFYWGLHSRDMPYWFVFAIGLIIDAATGLPFGLSALLNVFFLAMLHAQHKYIHKEGFVILWGYFGLLLGAVSVLSWLLVLLFYGQSQGVKAALIQWFLTVCCYPVFHHLFNMLTEHIARRRWKIEHVR